MNAPAALAELCGVSRSYQAAEGGFVLQIPRLRIAAGERVVVLGPSGSGKSTLLDLLAFLAPPDRAQSFAFTSAGFTHDVADLWRRGRRRTLSGLRGRHVGYVLQTGGLLPYLSVRENILLSRRLLGLAIPGPLEPLCERLGLMPLLQRRPSQLSVGQRQRAAVARAIAHEPALVLADEPTAALDAGLALAVMDALFEATLATASALVLVTHDAALAGRAAARVVQCRPQAGAGLACSVLED